MEDAEQFLSFLHSLSDMGAAMRHAMGSALTNEQVYKTMTQGIIVMKQLKHKTCYRSLTHMIDL